MEREQVVKLVQEWQAQGYKVGYTSGTFDLLHYGHIEYLAAAKKLCDRLVVGVNSDASVKIYKSPDRPIVSENSRIAIISALNSVSAAFLFDEKNNNKNIELIKPDFYIKAGDYNTSTLSSASIVESYGGQVAIVQFENGYSSTAIIDKILDIYGGKIATCPTEIIRPLKPAIFYDRDGTLNEHVEYLHEPSKFKLIPRAAEAIKLAQDAGYLNIIVTNQAGIGLGYFTKEDFYRVNRELLKAVSKIGAQIDKIYFSPYSQSDNAECRKPKTGMIDRAVSELNVDLSKSYVIGDMTGDIMLAKNAGCKSVLVNTGYAGKDGHYQVTADLQAEDVYDALQQILN